MEKFRTFLQENTDPVAEIARRTGLRAKAVKGFIDDNNINPDKLMQDLGQKKLDFKDLMTAVAGKEGNKYFVKIVKEYGE